MPRPLTLPTALAGLLAAALITACGGDGDVKSIDANADSASMAWNESVTVDVLANDSSNDGPVTLDSVSEPAHGTAKVVDGRLVYTPDPGWFGTETVTYTARGAGISVPVDVRIAVQARMTLAGTVADAPLAQAAVTVTVDGDSFTTTTDGQGRYRVAITADAQSDVVRIEAAGSGPQSAVRLVGFAGTAGAVAKGIDANGVVAAEKAKGLDVSHVSTAVAALVSRGAKGEPRTGNALDMALDSVSPEQAMGLAALLHRLIDHGEALPEGKADTWAFALDAGAARVLHRRLVDSGVWWSALSQMQDTAPAARFAGPSTGTTTLVMHDGWEPGELWLLRADGTGTATADDGEHGFSWKVDAGDLLITWARARLRGSWEVYDPQASDWVQARIDTTGLRVRWLDGRRIVLVAPVESHTATEGARSGQVIASDLQQPWQPAAVAAALKAYPVIATDLAPGSRWAGPVLRAPENRRDGLAADVMQVRSGSRVRLELSGVERSLSQDTVDGSFSLKDDSGAEWRYTRIRPAGSDGLEAWLVQGRLDGTTAWAAVVPMAPLPTAAYKPVAAEMARDWVYQPDALDGGWRVGLKADGSVTGWSDTTTWALRPDGELRIESPGADGSTGVQQWRPVALADGRLLLLYNYHFVAQGEQLPTDPAVLDRYRTLLSFQASAGTP